VLALAVEPEYGGRWVDHLTWSVAIEELAKISTTASLVAAYVRLVALPIVLAGTEDQRRVLAGLADGSSIGSYALTEPGAGSDPAALATRAECRGGGWILDGEKRFIGNAGESDVMVVFARTGGLGAAGVSALLVPGDAASRPCRCRRWGWRAGAIRFERVQPPGDGLLGPEGQGFKLAMRVFDGSGPRWPPRRGGRSGRARPGARLRGAPSHVRAAAGRARRDPRSPRRHDGDLAAARALPTRPRRPPTPATPDLPRLAAASKMVAADTAMRVTTDVVQILGGNGYLTAFPAEPMMRDAKVCQIYEGASEIQRLVLGRRLVRAATGREPVWPDAVPAVRAGTPSGA
jgi:alkylation response protein AidB-like acyl-CoA dehydrogenase